jgi:RNA polymerase sigma-70 factor (family 1)
VILESYNDLTDSQLAGLLKLGDTAAYAEIYDRYWVVLYRYTRKILLNEDEAEDVVQDIFVMLWSKSLDLDIRVSLSSFLYASVRNRILKHFERSKVRNNYLNSLEKFIDEGKCITDHLVREHELATRIEAELAQLPAKMREVFELSRKAHLSYKEISEKLEISELTVKKQVSNATKVLRIRLADTFSFFFTFF